jgi:hypothetical protein
MLEIRLIQSAAVDGPRGGEPVGRDAFASGADPAVAEVGGPQSAVEGQAVVQLAALHGAWARDRATSSPSVLRSGDDKSCRVTTGEGETIDSVPKLPQLVRSLDRFCAHVPQNSWPGHSLQPLGRRASSAV